MISLLNNYTVLETQFEAIPAAETHNISRGNRTWDTSGPDPTVDTGIAVDDGDLVYYTLSNVTQRVWNLAGDQHFCFDCQQFSNESGQFLRMRIWGGAFGNDSDFRINVLKISNAPSISLTPY